MSVIEGGEFFRLTNNHNDGKFRSATTLNEFSNVPGKKMYYFIKLERMYLDCLTFPIDSTREHIKFAVLKPNKDTYNRYSVESIYDEDTNKEKFFISKTETVSSYTRFCECINLAISKAIEKIFAEKEIYSITYPHFNIYEDKLTCIELNRIINEEVEVPIEHLLGFDNEFYTLIGYYFNCDYGINDKGEIFYAISPLDNMYIPDKLEIVAKHQVNDFFYPDRTIYIETSRATDPKFDESDEGYSIKEIHFKNDQAYIDLNLYLLLGSWLTVDKGVKVKHYVRLTLDIEPEFHPLKEMNILIYYQTIEYNDIHDNISLFNASPGCIYTETEYNEMTFRKFINLNAENVHINNDPVETQLELIHNHLTSQFPLVQAQDNNNMYVLVKNIHDIANQSQLITPYGPTMAPPGNKKIKLNIN